MVAKIAVVAVLALAGTAQAADETSVANPIRKVVTLLQNMQKKVTAEGEKEEKIYQKKSALVGLYK